MSKYCQYDTLATSPYRQIYISMLMHQLSFDYRAGLQSQLYPVTTNRAGYNA